MWFFFICYIFSNFLSNNCIVSTSNPNVDVSKTNVWGPGLNPDKIVLRARYIFLQLVDKNGKNISESLGEQFVSASIFGETYNHKTCHIWIQTFDCKDGSYIVRYRLYNTCYNLNIILKVKNELINLKNHQFKGPIYEEECNCPIPIQKWLSNNYCYKNREEVINNLKKFTSINFDTLRNQIIDRYNIPNSVSICHYVIKTNKIYRQCYGQHTGFKMFVDDIFLSLSRKIILPDIEFFMNLGDWPLVPKNKIIYPIFSWCGSEDFDDIILPTYDITKSTLEGMGSVTMDILSIQGNTKKAWENKIEKMFWRGRDSRQERLKLIDIAKNHPNLFNASITNFFFFQKEMKKYGPPSKHISFFEFFEYKYQINVDGSVAAYRLPYLLAGDSLVFKQNSKYFEFFYKNLKEGEHFIPVNSDLSDLVDKVKWAIENDEEAYNITRQARQFVRSFLLPLDIYCYHANLIQEWSKILKNNVFVHSNMEQVPMPNHDCGCDKIKKDEL